MFYITDLRRCQAPFDRDHETHVLSPSRSAAPPRRLAAPVFPPIWSARMFLERLTASEPFSISGPISFAPQAP